MDKLSAKLSISEDLVINKSFYEPLASDLSCTICTGILASPVICSQCESPFCSTCILEWTKKNNQCIMKCGGTFKPKSIPRMIKNIMEKVMLRCPNTNCKEQISMIKYPSHIILCSKLIIGLDDYDKIIADLEKLEIKSNKQELTNWEEIRKGKPVLDQ